MMMKMMKCNKRVQRAGFLLVLLVGTQAVQQSRSGGSKSRLLRSLELASQPPSSRRRLGSGSAALLRELGLDSPSPRRRLGSVLLKDEILAAAAKEYPRPQDFPSYSCQRDVVIETTDWTWFGHRYREGQRGVILYKVKVHVKQDDKETQSHDDKWRYIIKFVTDNKGKLRDAGPVVYEVEPEKFKIMCDNTEVEQTIALTTWSPNEDNDDFGNLKSGVGEADSSEELLQPDKWIEGKAMDEHLKPIPVKELHDHALIMAYSLSGEKPKTDVVVEITNTRRRGWCGVTKYKTGQIGVLMEKPTSENSKPHVKIVVGKDHKLFVNANYRNIRPGYFKMVQYGPDTKEKSSGNEGKSIDKVKNYLGWKETIHDNAKLSAESTVSDYNKSLATLDSKALHAL